MSWFDDFVNTVEDVANAIGDAVAGVVEQIGNGIEQALSLLGDIPILGDIIRRIGRIISSAFEIIATAIKAVLNVVGGVLGGIMRLLGGIFTLDGDMILRGVGDIVSAIVGAVILLVAKVVSLVQVIIWVEPTGRKLTADEMQLLARVFQKSLSLRPIRLVEGFAGLWSINDRPFTLGNVIYLKDIDISTHEGEGNLVHESVHVWQYQHYGVRYVSDALWAQATLPGHGYDWEAELASGHSAWVDFNREAQAQFLQDVFNLGTLTTGGVVTGPGGGVFFDASPPDSIGSFMFDGSDRTALADNTVSFVRAAPSARTDP